MPGWNFTVVRAKDPLGPDVAQTLPEGTDSATAQKLYAAGHAIVANLGEIPPGGWQIIVTEI